MFIPKSLARSPHTTTLTTWHYMVRSLGFAFESSSIYTTFVVDKWNGNFWLVIKREVGQVKRLNELDQSGAFHSTGRWRRTASAIVIDMLQKLHRNCVTCVVCIKGSIGRARQLIVSSDLLRHVKDVYGRT